MRKIETIKKSALKQYKNTKSKLNTKNSELLAATNCGQMRYLGVKKLNVLKLLQVNLIFLTL